MLDLPKGVITEKRKGGPSVLSLLAEDLIISKVDSYIRTELKIENSSSKIGYVVFRNGFPLMAMYAIDEVLESVDALEKIDDDAAELDCLLTIHRNVDVDLLLQTFPNSLLNLELEIDSENKSEWWKKKEIDTKVWTSSKILPEQTFNTTNSQQFEKALDAKLRRLSGTNLSELYPGYAYLIKENEPVNSIKLASKLGEIEHELMVISRIPSKRISEDYDIPRRMCYWLTEKKIIDENIIGPQLEFLYSEIKQFFEKYNRSVVLLDGLEFLYAIHGRDRTLDFLRRLVDISTTSDDIALIPVNLDVFDSRTQALIIRELDELNSEDLADWLISPEELEGHLFHLPDQQEIIWDEKLSLIDKNNQNEIELDIQKEEKIESTDIIKINNEGSRLDLSGIIKEWGEEDSSNGKQEELIQNDNIIVVDEDNSLQNTIVNKGPKKPTKVKRLGTKHLPKKENERKKYSNLEEATVISKKENYFENDSKWNIKDKNKTYRQYYDASKHKGNSGGED